MYPVTDPRTLDMNGLLHYALEFITRDQHLNSFTASSVKSLLPQTAYFNITFHFVHLGISRLPTEYMWPSIVVGITVQVEGHTKCQNKYACLQCVSRNF